MSFSQRHGFKPLKTVIQIESMDTDLRNGLWNVSYDCMGRQLMLSITVENGNFLDPNAGLRLIRLLWRDHFKLTVDDTPSGWPEAHYAIREYFFSRNWNEVYDFLEFLVEVLGDQGFVDDCNVVLKRELSGYRFVGNLITPITSEAEISAIEEARRNTEPIPSVLKHLDQALAHFADRKAPDYRNSIKESISAVEGICRLIAGNSNASLGQALMVVDKKVSLHSSLKGAFEKLYGYTSNAQGIRHALMDEPNLDLEDAKFMLVACSGFINYLIVKASKARIGLGTT